MASADILRAAHTETPWVVQRSSVSNRISNVSASNSLGDRITLVGFSLALGVPGEEAYENTEFIVRACNAHYQMLEALKQAQAALAMMVSPHVIGNTSSGQAWAACFEADVKARAAIAAAEAEAGR